eukprot:TRINITY_DN1800_c0_g1_i6.p1 TRINITY_DN1800_c0_g1~~TRINITY_DN1800_c0_g1_i6.p1  ORF type:complete len:243 (-),score=55.27 TRINITY_DN1800_c0_g1_i6:25-753(-)
MLERGEETGFEVRGKRYTDLVGILLEARDADTDQPLESREIREEVDTFMFEGHDTTASGISWTLYHLAAHPDVQEKAYEEIDRVLGDKTCPAYEDLSSLPYMTCVLKESMRLFPPVPAIGRTLDQDLEMDGYVIPKGCQVEIMPYVSHRNPLVWDDPEVFDPYRFDATNPAIATRDPFAAIPFSAGPRNCVGQHFAMNEEKTIISMILKRFRVELVKEHKVVLEPHLVSRPQNGIRVRLRSR